MEEMEKQLQEEINQLTYEETLEEQEEIENPYIELGITENDFH